MIDTCGRILCSFRGAQVKIEGGVCADDSHVLIIPVCNGHLLVFCLRTRHKKIIKMTLTSVYPRVKKIRQLHQNTIQ